MIHNMIRIHTISKTKNNTIYDIELNDLLLHNTILTMTTKLYFSIITLLALRLSIKTSAQLKKLTTVVIDAGHGGKDSGAVGKVSMEKDIVLPVALQVGKYITDSIQGVNVVYTRDKDVFVPLDERANIANKSGADLFISIHANSAKSAQIYGAETYVLGLHRSKDNLAVAQKENSVIAFEDDYTNKYEGFDPSQPESYIIFELMQNAYLGQSIQFASAVQDGLTASQRENRGVKQAGFLVLRQTSMPSVLIEIGFISNPTEEAYINSVEGQNEIARSIYNSFKKYKESYDNSNTLIVPSQPTTKESEIKKEEPTGISFYVQIISSKNQQKDFPESLGEVKELKENDMYKYIVCRTTSYDEAQKNIDRVRKLYPDCFIVAFDGAEKISVRHARKRSKQ